MYYVAERFHLAYNSHEDNCFIVWKEDGTPRIFIPGQQGLYYCNLREVDGILFATISTVDGNKVQYTHRHITHKESSRKTQNSIGVTTQGWINIIDNKQ